MKKELPINHNPFIRTYSYYAFPHCIIDSPFYINKTAARLTLFDYENYQWNIVNDDLQYNHNSDSLTFECTNEYLEKMNACLFRNLLPDDFIRVRIDYQQYTEPWGAINLFITDLGEENIMNDDQYIYRLGNFNYDGVYFRLNNKLHKIVQSETGSAIELLLHYNESGIEAYVGEKNGKLKQVFHKNHTFETKKNLKIGIQVKLNDNTYYKWLFSNYIQMSCDLTHPDRRLEFFYGTRKIGFLIGYIIF